MKTQNQYFEQRDATLGADVGDVLQYFENCITFSDMTSFNYIQTDKSLKSTLSKGIYENVYEHKDFGDNF